MNLSAFGGVRIATPDELPAIGRFRYAALLSDPGFRPSAEMRAAEQLVDTWDACSDVLVAMDGEDILGTFRMVYLRRIAEAHGREVAVKAFAHLGVERALETFALESINIVGRLAVAPNVRGSRMIVDLLGAAMHILRAQGERLTLADCSPPLVKLYVKLAGFFRSGDDYMDPVYGVKAPIMGTIGDHQSSVNAAIGWVAASFPDDPEARAFRLRVTQSLGGRVEPPALAAAAE